MLISRKLLGAVFVTALFITGAVTTQAKDRDDRKCERRVEKAEQKLRQAERRHGEHSRQAEHLRHELEEARERCHHRDRDRDHDHDHR